MHMSIGKTHADYSKEMLGREQARLRRENAFLRYRHITRHKHQQKALMDCFWLGVVAGFFGCFISGFCVAFLAWLTYA
jgi:hypothetical protein